MSFRAAARESLTPHGAVFESHHRACSTLHYHRHGYAFATIVLQGAYTEVCDGQPKRFLPANVVVHRAHEEHADHFSSDAHCLNVELAPGLNVETSRGANPNVAEAGAAVIRAFYNATTSDRRDDLGEAVARFQHALTAQTQPATPLPAWLSEVLQQFSWPEPVPFEAVARLAGVHQTHFSRSFRRHLGMTPQAFRARARVQLASELLLASRVPVAEIGLRCGFVDQAHFTRTFGRTTGVPPAAYRRVFAR